MSLRESRVRVGFPRGKTEMNVCLSVMDFLNLCNSGVLEPQGPPYAARDSAGGYVCIHLSDVGVWL